MNLSINTQELQDKTQPDSKDPLIFKDSMGVEYQITRYIPVDGVNDGEVTTD